MNKFFLCLSLFLALFAFVETTQANVNDKNDASKFSSPAAEQNYESFGNLESSNSAKVLVAAISSKQGPEVAYRSAGCSSGCSSGCSVGCSAGCSSGCSSGCSVGCGGY